MKPIMKIITPKYFRQKKTFISVKNFLFKQFGPLSNCSFNTKQQRI